MDRYRTHNQSVDAARRIRTHTTKASCDRWWTGKEIGLRLVAIVGTVSWLNVAASEQGLQSFRFDHSITIADLPSGTERRTRPGLNADEVNALLMQQPMVILDHATLVITAPDLGSSRSLMFRSLELLHGSTIITNGISLEIDAGLITSDGGQIVAYSREPSAGGAAPMGRNGIPGLNAGTLVIDSELNGNDLLHVNLSGQSGQGGGAGLKGPTGVAGPRGEDAADHLFDCAHGGGDGGSGAQGGRGGDGGSGGAGGAGGRLLLRGKLVQQRAQIDFVALGGAGGAGGDPGVGGDGGPGGSGGSGSTYCHGGHGGAIGVAGPMGSAGKPGPTGDPGSILAN